MATLENTVIRNNRRLQKIMDQIHNEDKQLTIILTLLKSKLLDHYIKLANTEKEMMVALKKNLMSRAG